MKELQGQPQRFYVGAEKALSISRDFSGFGTEITQLRKRLRKDGCDIMDSFPPYGAWFRRRFGIENEQAMDLFHQTVSMKSVGNLTDFVRSHMLEPFDVQSRIKALIAHFEDLSRAHEAVMKARHQIQVLTPIINDCDQYQQYQQQAEVWRQGREALATFFALKKLQLLEQRLENLQQDHQRQEHKAEQLEQQVKQQQLQQQALKQQIADNGGDRIERLKQDIEQLAQERERRSRKADRYRQLISHLSLPFAEEADSFIQQQSELEQQKSHLLQQQDEKINRLRETEFDFLRKNESYKQLKQTITELKSRQNNIEQIQIDIRNRLCADLSLDESELPFAGELLQVREDEQHWQGAIERLLRNFGLSMLVPDEHYEQVAQWVDKTNLRGRLVYYRVRQPQRNSLPFLHPDSLVHKIAIKPDSQFYPWLEQEMARRFDVACCETQAQFRREKRAMTLNGQIKAAGERHEKDDRFALNDRQRFVLGWSNKEKI